MNYNTVRWNTRWAREGSVIFYYIRSSSLKAPGLHINDLGAQMLDVDELFNASPFLNLFLLLHLLEQSWYLHAHISATWLPKDFN